MKRRDGGWKFLQISIEDHTARVRLNRPPVNALDRELVAELTSVAGALAKQREVRVVALVAAGPVFCAGADLTERAGMPPRRVAAAVKNIQRMIDSWIGIEQPVISGIHGAALGGGFELALAADIIAASESALLGLPEVNLGIIPAGGGTQRLTQRASLGTAAKWILSGARFTAREALADRAIDYVFPASSFEEDFGQIVSRVASCAPLALRQAKRALGGLYKGARLKGFKLESNCYAPLIASRDRLEALRAFAEKRKPVWQGK